MRVLPLIWSFVGITSLLAAVPVAQQGGGREHRPAVRGASRHDTSRPLRLLPQLPPRAAGAVLQRKLLPHRIGSRGAPGDGALQSEGPVSGGAPAAAASFEGLGNVNLVLPPDPSGDIGLTHYVQMVNLSLAIWNREGTLLYGPADTNSLWQGFGGACGTSNDGDPIVLYDQLADRWLLSQFALPNLPKGPFYQCIAISQTGDPTAAYHRYEFLISDTKLNDYPKFGVWPDGYYLAFNQYTCPGFCSFAGQGVATFERDRMLAGEAARMVSFDLYDDNPNLGGMLPSDLDGPALARPGSANQFCEVDDDAWGYSGDQIQCWGFSVNWSNPGLSSFTFDSAHPTAAFDSNLCLYSRNCIPQRDTGAGVDALSDRLMHRLQYRTFDTHETLVVNHTVDATGGDRAAIRWYELRNYGSGWGIHQQGTYSPDGHHRWMGSIAMNRAGDAALGFSLSSADVYPSIRATGRLAGDPAGTMTQGELAIADGQGHQTHVSGRWGDYSTMSVDPVDDCTFWYTQEYYGTKGEAPWQTRIGAFRFRDCDSAPPPPGDPDSRHVGDLDRASSSQRNTWVATVTIAVHDAHHAPVGGATVTGAWSGGSSGAGSCVTSGAGRCIVSKTALRKNLKSVTFSVTGIAWGSVPYAAEASHDPDGDSNGATITVLKP